MTRRRWRWAAVAVAALALLGCDSTYQLTGGHIDCGRGLHWRLNPAGFTTAQRQDVWIAAGMVGAELHTAITFDGFTSESSASDSSGPADYVLVEHRPTWSGGRAAAATSSPHAEGTVYTGGEMAFNPSADSLPAGQPLNGLYGSTYLKLAMHEWGHYAGLLTLTGHPDLLMNNGATAPGWGPGDLAGLHSQACR